ncbi:MAG: diguanylate cyclase [Spongiibacteraceae bacterium]
MEQNGYVALTNVVDLLLDAVCIVDRQGHFLSVSAACERIFGYTPDEMIGRPMIEMVFPDDREKTLNVVDDILAGQSQPHFENRYIRKDGRIVHIMWSARWLEGDQVRIAVARDVTERKRAESVQAALYAISEAAYSAEDLIALFHRIHRIIGELLPAVNFFVALYDEDTGELTFPYYVDASNHAPSARTLDEGTLSAHVVRTGRTLLRAFDANASQPPQQWLDVGADLLDWLGVPLQTQKGVIGALAVQNYRGDSRYTQQDVELLEFVSTQVAAVVERKKIESWLQHVALHDQLTGLPNRGLFLDRLQTALALARRDHTQLSLLYLDLDMFKPVNDTFGHAAGDLLLQQVADRLRQCVRESDTVGRFGGDEFLVLLTGTSLQDDAVRVAEKIHAALNQPFHLSGRELRISPSIGVALYPEHAEDYQQLIRCADDAMYRAKREGGNRLKMAVPPVAN